MYSLPRLSTVDPGSVGVIESCSRRTFCPSVQGDPVPANEWTDDIREPRAAGREAFWAGRSICSNPLIGHAAREWKEGWNVGLAEFVALSDRSALPPSALERRRLLNKYRPDDILLPFPQGRSRDQVASGSGDV